MTTNKPKDAKARIWMDIGPQGPGGPQARFDREDVRGLGGTGPTGQNLPYFVWSAASATTGQYLAAGPNVLASSTANPLGGVIIAPVDCLLQFATLEDVQQAGVGNAQCTLYHEGVATFIQCILGTNSLTTDDTHTIAVARGERIAVICDVNNGKPLLQFSCLMIKT